VTLGGGLLSCDASQLQPFPVETIIQLQITSHIKLTHACKLFPKHITKSVTKTNQCLLSIKHAGKLIKYSIWLH